MKARRVLFRLCWIDHVTIAGLEAIGKVLVELVVIKRVQWHHFRYTEVLQVHSTEIDWLGLWMTCATKGQMLVIYIVVLFFILL